MNSKTTIQAVLKTLSGQTIIRPIARDNYGGLRTFVYTEVDGLNREFQLAEVRQAGTPVYEETGKVYDCLEDSTAREGRSGELSR